MLVLPKVVVESPDVEPHSILRSTFDRVWNAFGLPRSFNFDEQGNWVAR